MKNLVCEPLEKYSNPHVSWNISILKNYNYNPFNDNILRKSINSNIEKFYSSEIQKSTKFLEYLLSWPEMTDEEFRGIKEKRKHLNKWK